MGGADRAKGETAGVVAGASGSNKQNQKPREHHQGSCWSQPRSKSVCRTQVVVDTNCYRRCTATNLSNTVYGLDERSLGKRV